MAGREPDLFEKMCWYVCRAQESADVGYEQRTAEARARRAAKDIVVIDSESVSSGSSRL